MRTPSADNSEYHVHTHPHLRDVVPGVRLAAEPEVISSQAWEAPEEADEEAEVVFSSALVTCRNGI